MGLPNRARAAGTDWRGHYRRRMIEPDEIAKRVRSGDRIYTVIGHDCGLLMACLIARADELTDVEIRRLGGFWEDYGLYTPEWRERIRVNASFATAPSHDAVEQGIIDFTVVGFGEVNRHIEQQRPESPGYDQCWFTITPPDDRGMCCVGTELWDLKPAMRHSPIRVAGVNEHLPRTFGDTWIHASEIDYFYEQHQAAPERMRKTPTSAARAVAKHISTLVRSGDTLQIGTGATTFALASLGAFDDKDDLGWFSELSTPGALDLVKRGIVTSKRATLHPNRFVTTGLTPTGQDECDYVDGNRFFEFHGYDYMLDPKVIARNDNMVSINNALAVDLLGQIAVSSLGPRIRAGTGGQLAFHMGAYLSKGGRAITVLPSTSTDGSTSRIVRQHPPGQLVTVPWDLADTVVTEYGVADLLGKSIRQRAEALIAIAHPDMRPELLTAINRLQ